MNGGDKMEKRYRRIPIEAITKSVERKGFCLFPLDWVYDSFNGGRFIIITNILDFKNKYPMYKNEIIMTIEDFKKYANVYNEFLSNEDRERKRRYGYTEEYDINLIIDNESNLVESKVFLNIEKEQLYKAMEQLTEMQSVRLKLFFFYGLTEREIADIQGVNRYAVRTSLNAGIKKLKKIL